MKRLSIDLEKCSQCKECLAECSYFYYPKNLGITRLRELGAFLYVCRKCEEAPCVRSCPKEALERQEDGILKRYVFRCVSCKSCSFACPFGTFPPDVVPYIISRCDVCLDRLDKESPLCTRTCNVADAVRFIDIEESKDKDIFLIGDRVAVHAVPWKKYHP